MMSSRPSASTSPAPTVTPPANPGKAKKLRTSAPLAPSNTLTWPPGAPGPAPTITSSTESPVTSPVATVTPPPKPGDATIANLTEPFGVHTCTGVAGVGHQVGDAAKGRRAGGGGVHELTDNGPVVSRGYGAARAGWRSAGTKRRWKTSSSAWSGVDPPREVYHP